MLSGRLDMTQNHRRFQLQERTGRVLARVRRRQLDTALTGQYQVSARYARLASRVKRFVGECAPCPSMAR